jgi:hypothetical protein
VQQRLLALVGILSFFAFSSQAQQVTASITGQVTDPSGAPVPRATVTATDAERGTQWPATTNSDGIYNLPRLQIGTYNVKVEAQGFATETQSNIQLQLNQVARLDFKLQLGTVSQTVEVTGGAPLLQTQSMQLGQVINAATNVNLPLATRNYVQLTLLAPGSIHPNPSTFRSGLTTSSSGRPNVNGNREQANNFMLDGLDNNQVSDNLVGYAPAVDAIQEFNEITLTAPADFGNYMGGIVSVTTKSGTNQFHGDLYEFFRNDKLNANSWTNNFLGVPRSATRWNNFGGSLGGPIKKDKLFFFVDYQGSRLDTPPSATSTTVYTALERTGNFSELLPKVQLYDPFSAVTTGKRAPYAGNIIPASQFNPVAAKILSSQYYPQPTRPGLLNNLIYSTHTYINGDQGDARVDWNASDKDRIFGRYSQSSYTNPTLNSVPLLYNSFAIYPTHTGVLDWVRTISPTLVNEARFGVNYVFVNNGSASNNLTNFAQTVGIPDVPSSFLPVMSMSGGNVSNFGTADVYQLFADAVIQYEDTLILTKGTHTMHFGFEGYRYRVDTFYSGNNGRAGQFLFNGQYTAGPNPGTKAGSGSGIAEADFLLGLPDEIQGGVNGGTWGQRANSLAAFFQDNWRVTPNLTLNLGLRWELHTPWVEVKNRQANFDLVTGQEYIAGQNGASRALYDQYNGITNFQPRIGFAFTPTTKTVVRGGYTLSNYLEGTGTNLRLTINPPFAVEHDNIYTTSAYNVLPGSTLDQGFTPFLSNAGDQFHNVTLRVWDPKIRPAVSNQWNFTIQQELTGSSTLTMAYVGSRTTHLMVPMPYFQKYRYPNGTVSPTTLFLAGNPGLLNDIGQISGTATPGNQSYQALQVTADKHLSHGLQFQASYTWSKCMTNSIGYYGQGGQAATASAYWQNIYNMAAEWGPCDYDATHNFVMNAIYSLPFGRNQQFGKNMNKVLDAFVGGWQLSGIWSWHSGFPLTITASDASNTKSRGARANCLVPGTVYGEQNSPSGGYQWFNPAAYGQPAANTFGNCGVGTIRGPGLISLDANIAKTFNITERQHLEIRGEFLNVTNTPILNAPTRGLGTTLGLLRSSQGARNVQLALKYLF